MKKYIHAGGVGIFIINFISTFYFSFVFNVPAVSAMMIVPPNIYSSVAFIPGLEASRLYASGLLSENTLWEPNTNADVDKLTMDTNGKSIRSDIYTADVIDTVGALFWKYDIYDGFMKYLDGLEKNNNIFRWEALPYDWRLGLNDVVNNGVIDSNGHISYTSSTTPDVSYMISRIKYLANNSFTGKVTLVTHSNGALVAKVLIQKLQDLKAQGKSDLIDSIDRVIMIAPPQLGAMDAVGSLLHGYNLHYVGGLVLNENHARAMAENMPGAYNLLPSRKYFENNVGPIITFATSTDSFSNFSKVYGRTISDYDTLEKFLTGADGRKDPSFGDTITPNVLNKNLLSNAESQHSTIDNWQFPSNIDVTQVAGVGIQTLSGIEYDKGALCSNEIMTCEDSLNLEPVFSDNGDGTVLSTSALLTGAKQLYFDMKGYNASSLASGHTRQHSDMLETSPIQQMVGNILAGSTNLPNFILSTKPNNSSKQLLIDAYSSIALNAYDEESDHTGLINTIDPNSDIQAIEQNIPNSSYVRFGGKSYLSLPVSVPASVTFQATDYGSINIDTSVLQNDMVISSSTFTDIPITPEMKGTIINATSSMPILALDVNGDGVIDATTTANTAFDPILYIEIMKKTIDSFDLKKAPEKVLIQRLDQLENKIKAGKIKNADKQIQRLIKSITHTNKKLRKISDDERNQLVTMLTNLVDNLN